MGWASYREDIISRYVGAVNLKSTTIQKSIASGTPAGKPVLPPVPLRKDPVMVKLKDFPISTPKPLPVILLVDVSGSMTADGKIDALNTAVAEMIASFAQDVTDQAQIQVAVITFGSEAKLHKPLTPATDFEWQPMTAEGRTAMGAAFDLATGLIEDQHQLPARAYRPAIVLVSDGVPTDAWRPALDRLLASERAKKAERFALGIGAGADRAMLKAFLANPAARVFEADESRQIKNFFRWIELTVTLRSRSALPNQSIEIDPADIENYDDF